MERRTAPLSYELSGGIFQHDFYGSHSNSHGNTWIKTWRKKILGMLVKLCVTFGMRCWLISIQLLQVLLEKILSLFKIGFFDK